MPLWAEFCSGSYRTRSTTSDAELCINLFPEAVVSPVNAKRSALYGTPGLDFLVTATGKTVCRGIFSQDETTLAVIQDTVYRLDVDAASLTPLSGTVSNDGAPVSMCSNGRGGEQVLIVSGGEVYVYDILTMTLSSAITTPLTNDAVMCAYIDGYFLLLEADTVRVWFSALEDGTSWDGLDFFARSQTSDNIVAICALKNRLYVIGSLTGEIYYDSGDADNPFQPYPGSVFQEGIVGPWAIGVVDESVAWVARGSDGRGRAVRTTDASPQPISTPAIDFAWASYTDLSSCEILVYQQEGHTFVCWTFPDART